MTGGRSVCQNAHWAGQDILSEPLVIFDTENTGLGADVDIVEIAWIDGEGEALLISSVRPAHPMPRDGTNVHGITSTDVKGAPTILKLKPMLQEIRRRVGRGNRVSAYNLDYDARLRVQSFEARRQR